MLEVSGSPLIGSRVGLKTPPEKVVVVVGDVEIVTSVGSSSSVPVAPLGASRLAVPGRLATPALEPSALPPLPPCAPPCAEIEPAKPVAAADLSETEPPSPTVPAL